MIEDSGVSVLALGGWGQRHGEGVTIAFGLQKQGCGGEVALTNQVVGGGTVKETANKKGASASATIRCSALDCCCCSNVAALIEKRSQTWRELGLLSSLF